MRIARRSVFLISVAAVLTAANAPAQGAELAGTNDPAQDVPNLQAAADAGGYWLLSGTFNLGSAGSIALTKDVTFEGAVGSDGAKARINGGDWAFVSPLPFATVFPESPWLGLPPITQPGPRIAIRKLHFDGAVGAAIHVAYSSRLDVTGNTIRSVHRRQLTPTYARHAGIDVGTNTYLIAKLRAPSGNVYVHLQPPNRRQSGLVPGAVTGEVTIGANDIEIDPPGSEAIATRSNGSGIYVNLLDGARVRISDNDVKGGARYGIEVLEPRRGADGSGSYLIERNRVVTPTLGNFSSNGWSPAGIGAGWGIDPIKGRDPAHNLPVTIRRNRIEMHGISEWLNPTSRSGSAGISSFADGAVIEHNEIITSDPSHFGMVIWYANALVRANTLSGAQGAGGLRVGVAAMAIGTPGTPANTWPSGYVVSQPNRNVFIGNNITQFNPDITYFPLVTDIMVMSTQAPTLEIYQPVDNVFVGSGGRVVTYRDQGIGTRITGYAAMTGGAGHILHDTLTEAMPPAP